MTRLNTPMPDPSSLRRARADWHEGTEACSTTASRGMGSLQSCLKRITTIMVGRAAVNVVGRRVERRRPPGPWAGQRRAGKESGVSPPASASNNLSLSPSAPLSFPDQFPVSSSPHHASLCRPPRFLRHLFRPPRHHPSVSDVRLCNLAAQLLPGHGHRRSPRCVAGHDSLSLAPSRSPFIVLSASVALPSFGGAADTGGREESRYLPPCFSVKR